MPPVSGMIEWMIFAALVVGTVEYGLLLRRRVVQRLNREAAESGLRGLVRTMLGERRADATPNGHYLPE